MSLMGNRTVVPHLVIHNCSRLQMSTQNLLRTPVCERIRVKSSPGKINPST